MADRAGTGRGPRAVALGLVLGLVVASCGGSTGSGAGPGRQNATGWVAAELSEVPGGLIVCEVRESSGQGRVVSYVHEAEGVGDNCEVTVTTSTTFYGWSVDEAIRFAQDNSDRPVTVTEVGGHEAMVAPMTDGGRVYGQQVVWEQAPGLVVRVDDARYEDARPVATEQSVLDLAEAVVGMDRARWDDAVADFDRSYEYAGPPDGASEQVLATGEVDGRPWTLSAWVGAARPGLVDYRCRRMELAGESTGPGCAPEWVVLGGTGFVLGLATSGNVDLAVGAGTNVAPIAGEGTGLTTVEPQRSTIDEQGNVAWVAVLPAGTCTVVLGDAPFVGAGARQLWLLPGDPGAAECADR